MEASRGLKVAGRFSVTLFDFRNFDFKPTDVSPKGLICIARRACRGLEFCN
jgi:hypothetical protein